MFFILIIFISILFNSCKINYSLSGASYSPDVLTFNVLNFENKAPIVYPPLANMLTESLKDKIISQTKLKLSNNNPDLIFEGYITDYNITPSAITGNNTVNLNRLSVSVYVKVLNTKNSSLSFDKTFSHYIDFDPSKDFISIENQLNKEIIEKITNDIFNVTFLNW